MEKLEGIKSKIIHSSILSCLVFTALVLVALGTLVATLVLERIYNRKPKLSVSIKRLHDKPIISSMYSPDQDNSVFLYNSRPTLFTMRDSGNESLLVQVDALKTHPEDVYDIIPASIVMTKRVDGYSNEDLIENENIKPQFEKVTADKIVVKGSDCDVENIHCGAREPRVTFVSHLQTYFMFYTTWDGKTNAIAYQTLSEDSWSVGDYTNWSTQKILFKGNQNFKSAALHYNESYPMESRLIFSNFEGLKMAQPLNTSFAEWSVMSDYLLKEKSPEIFASGTMKPGNNPIPITLNDETLYFMFYNAEMNDYGSPSPREGWTKGSVIGYVIYDKFFKVRFATIKPVMVPELDWERCDDSSVSLHNTGSMLGFEPNTVFVNGVVKVPQEDQNINKFIMYYAGCQSYIGTASVTISLS